MKHKLLAISVVTLFLLSSYSVLGNNTNDKKENLIYLSNEENNQYLTSEDIARLQERAKIEGWTFTVGENVATKRSFNQLCGFVVPDNYQEIYSEEYPLTLTGPLPDSFDWRDLGGCTPVKDQGQCGSCWAFGTVAPFECNILIKDQEMVILSEQYLINCNQDNYGCNGGWWAHEYFCGEKLDSCEEDEGPAGDYGGVIYSDLPYTATKFKCSCPYDHPYKLVGYSSIPNNVDSIKQAILTYGPVSTSVSVNEEFVAYTGGIFDGGTGGITNHAVALVGWNDDGGYWILRNSWSASWGEGGYMRIKYGSRSVGSNSRYVVYHGEGPQIPAFDIRVNYPREGRKVTGVVDIKGEILAEIPSKIPIIISKVMIKIDEEQWKQTEGLQNWKYRLWDTTEYSEGRHKIYVKALGFNGDIITSDMVNVTVDNYQTRFFNSVFELFPLLIRYLFLFDFS